MVANVAAILWFSLTASLMMGMLGVFAGLWAEKFDQLAAVQNFLISQGVFNVTTWAIAGIAGLAAAGAIRACQVILGPSAIAGTGSGSLCAASHVDTRPHRRIPATRCLSYLCRLMPGHHRVGHTLIAAQRRVRGDDSWRQLALSP